MKFYNKPYPFNEDLKHNAKIIFFISIGILGVLLIFQPLEFSELNRKDVFYLTTGIAASTFLSLAINLIVLPSFLPKIFNQFNSLRCRIVLINQAGKLKVIS